MDFEAEEEKYLGSVFDGGMEIISETDTTLELYLDMAAEIDDDDPMTKAQKALEMEMKAEAEKKAKKADQRLARTGQRNRVKSFDKLLKKELTDAADELERLYGHICQGRYQPNYVTDDSLINIVKRLRNFISWDQMAYIGLQIIIQSLSNDRDNDPYESFVVPTIAEAVDFEAFTEYLNEFDERLLAIVSRRYLKSQTTNRGKKIKATIDFIDERGTEQIQWHFLSEADQTVLGNFIKEALYNGTGLFERFRVFGKKKNEHVIILSAHGRKLHAEIEEKGIKGVNQAWAMIVPPTPWTTDKPGGYKIAQPGARSQLIHNNRDTHIAPEALRALNNVQSVAWRINSSIYDVLYYYIKNKLTVEIGSFSTYHKDTYEPTQKELDNAEYVTKRRDPELWKKAENDPELHKQLVRAYRVFKETEAKRTAAKQKALNPKRVLSVAKRFKKYDRIWMPWFFDSRLRMYCLCDTLNPQGSDWTKALLKFADGTPVSEDSKRELLISIATTYGNGLDKKTYQERIDGALELVTKDQLKQFASSTKAAVSEEGMKLWTTADEPFQYLALCQEYYRLFILNDQKDRYHYVSAGRDATCSGIQITGALLRDERTCKFVNVLPSDRLQDAYREVAMEARKLLQDEQWVTDRIEHRESRRELSVKKQIKEEEQRRREGLPPLDMPVYERRDIVEIPLKYVDRSVAKMVVMLTPYGGAYITMLGHVREKLEEKGVELHKLDYEILTHALIGGMAKALPAYSGLNQWFKDLGKLTQELHPDANQVKWVTPVGSGGVDAQSLISQEYRKPHTQIVRTRIHGDTHVIPRYFRKRKPDDFASELQKTKMQTALAANVVHSLDAAIIQLAVADYHNSAFTCVHDCVYAPSGALSLLTDRIKKAFYTVCSGDFLYDMIKENGLEQTDLAERLRKMTGNAPIEQVAYSDYLFC